MADSITQRKSIVPVRIIAALFVVPSFFSSVFFITNLTALSNLFDLLKFMELTAALLAGYLLWQFSKLGRNLAIILCSVSLIQTGFLLPSITPPTFGMDPFLFIFIATMALFNFSVIFFLTRRNIAQQFT